MPHHCGGKLLLADEGKESSVKATFYFLYKLGSLSATWDRIGAVIPARDLPSQIDSGSAC